MRRHILKSFVSRATNWNPKFVIQMPEGRLVHQGDGTPQIFDTIRDAVQWIEGQDAHYNSSLEWEGTYN